jgi:5-carboxymethyl-2-hydroxymuconate isomerase
MPHIIIEHSADFTKNSVDLMKKEIPQIMGKITEGNFDADQCKCRSHSFDEYLVGTPDQSSASFLHITIKILSGRTLEAQKKLSAQVIEFVKKTFNDLGLETKRCDISIDIVEMNKEAYQKTRIE